MAGRMNLSEFGDCRGGRNGGKSDVCPWILDVMMMHGGRWMVKLKQDLPSNLINLWTRLNDGCGGNGNGDDNDKKGNDTASTIDITYCCRSWIICPLFFVVIFFWICFWAWPFSSLAAAGATGDPSH